jgi:beta-barrel assembly-enhancing protease
MWLLFLVLLLCVPETAARAGNLCAGENENARAMMQRIEEEWPLRSRQDSVSRYVQSLGNRLADGFDRKYNRPWRFTVVRDRSINAFSIGAGYVYVTEGSVALARNESEIAAVLAHEMGHQMSGHFCKQAPGFWSSFLNLFGAGNGNSRPAGIQSGIGNLTQVTDPVKEREADQLAVRILSTGGFDTHAILDLAERLQDSYSHLQDPRRIQALRQLLREYSRRAAKNSRSFEDVKQLL